MNFIDFATIFSVALFASFGHCIGMCGGFVVLYTSSFSNKTTSILKQFCLHIVYNFGRISSYVILGVVFGLIGSVLSISKTTQGYLFFIIGIFMVLMGLSLLGQIKFLHFFEAQILTKPSIKKMFNFFIKSKSILGLYFLGMLNGFIPCGLVYFFLISAVASSSVFYGAMTMLVFGIVTLPAMFGFGFMVGFLTQNNRDIML
ncbi:MAG: sulfite exporter TauE/SafE family protein, partial [Campylobacteraceae bacterium]|nr:sulfite exporter TauE/SafE family protein [Campylobacteraceae bacterium]